MSNNCYSDNNDCEGKWTNSLWCREKTDVIIDKGDTLEYKCTLTIRDIIHIDNGTYTCNIEKDYNGEDTMFHVSVLKDEVKAEQLVAGNILTLVASGFTKEGCKWQTVGTPPCCYSNPKEKCGTDFINPDRCKDTNEVSVTISDYNCTLTMVGVSPGDDVYVCNIDELTRFPVKVKQLTNIAGISIGVIFGTIFIVVIGCIVQYYCMLKMRERMQKKQKTDKECLITAVTDNNLLELNKIITNKSDLLWHTKDKSQNNVLHLACMSKSDEIRKKILNFFKNNKQKQNKEPLAPYVNCFKKNTANETVLYSPQDPENRKSLITSSTTTPETDVEKLFSAENRYYL
jgi:hypothetical protein